MLAFLSPASCFWPLACFWALALWLLPCLCLLHFLLPLALLHFLLPSATAIFFNDIAPSELSFADFAGFLLGTIHNDNSNLVKRERFPPF
jgi:hypothetical protein